MGRKTLAAISHLAMDTLGRNSALFSFVWFEKKVETIWKSNSILSLLRHLCPFLQINKLLNLAPKDRIEAITSSEQMGSFTRLNRFVEETESFKKRAGKFVRSHSGALGERCLVEKGNVAFVKLSTVLQNTDVQLNACGPASDDSRKLVAMFTSCSGAV
ncbi:Nucleoporin Gle1 [Manis pentadactyla]|nr:Nucleoporin Gle1 [Manis pentadactyla]